MAEWGRLQQFNREALGAQHVRSGRQAQHPVTANRSGVCLRDRLDPSGHGVAPARGPDADGGRRPSADPVFHLRQGPGQRLCDGAGAGGTVIDQAAFDRLLNELDARLARCLFGLPADHWLETIKDGRGFAHWCETTGTGAARLLRHLLDSGEAAIGQSSVAALPEIPDAELIARLTAPDGAEFIARPTWNGCAHETSPFTRRAACAPLPDLVPCYGRGILARLAAQLLEVACLLAEIRTDLADAPASTPVESGIGIGRAAAARGLLIHLAQVEQGRIRDYRILAPTEWNFHPQGVVAQALMSLPDAGDDTLKRQAERIIMATDPCVAFDLTLTTANCLCE